VVRSFPGKDPVFHPVISPDGNWVAWCTVLEGSTGTSRIKVRRLAKNDSMVLDLGTGAIPRWWVDGTDTFLVRVSSAIDNIDSDWASGQTIAQRWSNGSLVDAARTWSSAGSYHDGRSGQYLYTGYKRLKQYDVSGKTSRTLFAYPRNGKDVGDTSQACNVSTAPDGSGRVMFLDFGYPGRSDVVGRPYGIHEVAFMADSTGAILQTFPVASGKSQWNHLEWSNHPGWAVGMALDGEFHHEIHLLDLNTGKATPIVSGADLGMPVLWVGTEELAALRGGVDPDSCGAYDQKANEESIGAYASAISSEYAAKIPLFWQSKDSLQVMFFGSSRSGRGFLPSELKIGKSFNFAAISTELFTCEKLISNYVIPNAKQLRLVVLDVIPGWFDLYDGDSIGYYSWKTISNSVGYKYDSSHGFWKNGLPDGYLGVLQSKGEAAKNWFAPVGEIHAESGGWSKSPQIVTYDSLLLVKKPGFKKNMALLRGLISKLKTQNINMLMVNFPVNPHYKEMGICDLYGPSCAVYHEVIDSIASLGKENGNFKLFDANLNGSHDYDSFEFSDDSHLSYLGAKKMTSRVDSILINWRE
jgi:hypothetical protein